MRDRLFFPVAAALAGAFILMALNPFGERLPTGPVSAEPARLKEAVGGNHPYRRNTL